MSDLLKPLDSVNMRVYLKDIRRILSTGEAVTKRGVIYINTEYNVAHILLNEDNQWTFYYKEYYIIVKDIEDPISKTMLENIIEEYAPKLTPSKEQKIKKILDTLDNQDEKKPDFKELRDQFNKECSNEKLVMVILVCAFIEEPNVEVTTPVFKEGTDDKLSCWKFYIKDTVLGHRLKVVRTLGNLYWIEITYMNGHKVVYSHSPNLVQQKMPEYMKHYADIVAKAIIPR